jgi:phosphopantetheinyl transferase
MNDFEAWQGRVLGVELRCLPLTGPDSAAAAGGLSAAEASYANSLRAVRRQREYVGARVLLRRVLADVLGLPPLELAIARTERGKPYLRDGSVHFNLAHAGAAVLIGWGDRPLGVDVETAARATRYIERVALVRELTATGVAPLVAFTLIEAALKAEGRGLGGLRKLRLVHHEGGRYRFELDGCVIDAERIALPDGYLGAVATLV